MPSINAIADFTGFDRGALTKRAKRLGLSGDIDPKQLLQLIPLSEAQEGALDLQAERAKNTALDSELKQIAIDKESSRLADVDDLMAANNERDEAIAQIIKKSELSEERKEDILGLISQSQREWGERYG